MARSADDHGSGRHAAFSEATQCVFAHGQRAISPLVGFMHGRLRIERDFAGVDRVRTHDGRSLGGINEMGTNRPSYLLSITPMRLADLAAAVKSQAAAARAR